MRDFLNMTDEELDSYMLNIFSNMSYEKQSSLLKNENFIRALFSSSGYAFCHLSFLFDDNFKLMEDTFSSKNVELLNTIDSSLVIKNFFRMEKSKSICDFMLQLNDYRFNYRNIKGEKTIV